MTRERDFFTELGEAHERLSLAVTDLQRASARRAIRLVREEASAAGVELPTEHSPEAPNEGSSSAARRPARHSPEPPSFDHERGWHVVHRFPITELIWGRR